MTNPAIHNAIDEVLQIVIDGAEYLNPEAVEKVREEVARREKLDYKFSIKFEKNGENRLVFKNPRKTRYDLKIRARLYQNMKTEDDGIFWALQETAVIKDKYNAADLNNSIAFQKLPVLENGDNVLINGDLYKVKVNGDYSDCAVFEKL